MGNKPIRKKHAAPDNTEALSRMLQSFRNQIIEECARVADAHSTTDFPMASENSEKYWAQALWAERIAKQIRLKKAKP